VSLAKTGCSFNDDTKKHKAKQLFYSYNPTKKGGIKIQVKLKAKPILDTLINEFNLEGKDSIYRKNNKGSSYINIETGFYKAVGKTKYDKILMRIIDLILEE
jgi:hypothetical protein